MAQDGVADPPGVDAHRRLLEAAVAQHLELPTPTGEYPHGGLHVLWREAERVQRAILGGWEVEAMDAVERLVQHALGLSSSADWFRSDLERRRMAIEETIVHNAYGWTVTSDEAQQAWRAIWLARRRFPQLMAARLEGNVDTRLGDLHSEFEDRARGLEADWLGAWDRWVQGSG